MTLKWIDLENKNKFSGSFFFTYASEYIIGEENTLDKVSCKPTIKSSWGSLFNKSARSATEAMKITKLNK